MSDEKAADRIRLRKLTLLLVDLAGYTRTVSSMDAVDVARFLDRWYARVVEVAHDHRGRVVKFMGDGALIAFADEDAVSAVDCAIALLDGADDDRMRAGVSVHLASVAEGDLGPPEHRRYDVVGTGVNHLFLMRRGPGLRISEPVYRQLPNDRRKAWQKEKPPATYALR